MTAQSTVFQPAYEQMWVEVKRQNLFSAGIEHIGLYYDNPQITQNELIKYDVCLRICKSAEPNGHIGVKELKGGKYAIFTYIGAYDNLGAVYNKIYGELLGKGGFER